MPCDKCAEFGGLWMQTPKGLIRCECLPAISEPKENAPNLTKGQSAVFVEMLASIPFFPSETGARLAIGDEIRAMCKGPHEAEWLVTRMRRLYRRWPGPLEMRHVYAAKFQPWDGVQPIGISEHYPDGIPSENETAPPAIAAPKVKLLAIGQREEIIEHPKIERAIQRAAEKMPAIPSGRPIGDRFEKLLAEAITAPVDRPLPPPPTPQVITQADIDRAVEDLHRQKTEQTA